MPIVASTDGRHTWKGQDKPAMNYTLRNMLIAGTLFAFGLVLVTSYVRNQNARIERGNTYVEVLVAKKDIPAGTSAKVLQTEGYVETDKVLQRDQAPQAIDDLADVEKLSLSQNVYKGEQISAYKFETQAGLNPTEQIKGTSRIASVLITPTGSAAGLIRPGDSVDVMATGPLKFPDRDLITGKVLKESDGSTKVTDGNCTWIAARDAKILQTPQSLAPAGDDGAPAPSATEPALYVLQVGDDEMQQLLWSQHQASDVKLQLLLRPSDGAQETKLAPSCAVPDAT